MKLSRMIKQASFPAFTAALVAAAALSGCASQTPRTKWTDKTMRVMIDPESIQAEDHVRIQQALVRSGKFVVVDRSAGFAAIKKEQERLHREDTDRFADREKFALWGKMYGVGGIVVAHSQCHDRTSLFHGSYIRCSQYLAIMDTNTGEVLAVSEAVADGEDGWTQPEWNETVEKLVDAYPRFFEKNREEKSLREYHDLAQEEATRAKEIHAQELIEKVKAVATPAPAPAEAEEAPAPQAKAAAPTPSLPEAPKAPEAKAPEAKAPEAKEAAKPAQEPAKEPVKQEPVKTAQDKAPTEKAPERKLASEK